MEATVCDLLIRDFRHTVNPALAPPACAPQLVLAGTSQIWLLPGSPSPLDRILPWRKAQRFAHAGICPHSIRWPFPPPSRALSAGLSTGCSGGRGAPAPAAFCFHTTSTCCPLGVQTTLGMFQPAHARSSVCRTLWPMISRLSLGWILCSQRCPSVYIHSVGSTCRPPTSPSRLSSLRRSALLDSRPRCVLPNLLWSLSHLVLFLPGGQPLLCWGCPSVPGPSGSRH